MGCGQSNAVADHQSGDFRTIVVQQLPTNKITVKKFIINYSHILQLTTLNLSKIKEINLQRCQLNHESLEGLTQIQLPHLVKLNLSHNQLGPLGCRQLSGSALIQKLNTLQLDHNKIKDVGVKFLVGADLSLIQDLSLNDNQITTQGLRSLSDKLQSIQCLSLGGNQLNDESLNTLKSLKTFQIYYLKLSRNNLSDEGLKKILKMFKNLDVLLMDRNNITQAKQAFQVKGVFLFY